MNSIILAFDYGTKSIGIAIGQMITKTARPLCAIKANDGMPDWQKIEQILHEWKPDKIIIGLPLNMDGTEQPLTAKAKKFAQRLHGRFGIPYLLHDERLTTVEAKDYLFQQGGYQSLKKTLVDAMSAVIILESWFDQQ